jgi:hypothetical protein
VSEGGREGGGEREEGEVKTMIKFGPYLGTTSKKKE